MARKLHFCDETYDKNIDKNKSTPFFWSTQPSSLNLTYVEENEREIMKNVFQMCITYK